MSFLLKKLVILLILLHATLSQGEPFWPFKRVHAGIKNTLPPGSSLTVHCQSKDDDLGVHVLPVNDSFNWSFKPTVFILATLFFCKIQWDTKQMSFDAYRETRDLTDCHTKCFWEVTDKGACMLKHDGGYGFCYDWGKNKTLPE